MTYTVTATFTQRDKGGALRFKTRDTRVSDRDEAERLALALVEAQGAHHVTFEEDK